MAIDKGKRKQQSMQRTPGGGLLDVRPIARPDGSTWTFRATVFKDSANYWVFNDGGKLVEWGIEIPIKEMNAVYFRWTFKGDNR